MDDDSLPDEEDPADRLLRRGDFLRKLRELEEQDEAERAVNAAADEQIDRCVHARVTQLSSGESVLCYESFLADQRYYDDLKHVDHKYIDFGEFNTESRLVVEQDKRLGKGGLCWDAAFILGEYVISRYLKEAIDKPVNAIELGSGTGLAGLIVGKALPRATVALTDLQELQPLMSRNVKRNFGSLEATEISTDPVLSEYLNRGGTKNDVRGMASSHVLSWGDKETEKSFGTFDVILGADVVATLYDPVALAGTISQLSHSDTVVYVSFKERLSSVHRQFEDAMQAKYENIEFVAPTVSRNHNPDVRILIASSKKE